MNGQIIVLKKYCLKEWQGSFFLGYVVYYITIILYLLTVNIILDLSEQSIP